MLKAFATYLSTVAGLTIGTDLFAGSRPANAPDFCTTLLERGPEIPDDYNKRRREKSIQLLTRGGDYFEARDESNRLFELLVGKQTTGVAISGWVIHTITGIAPQFLSEDQRGRFEFSTNLVVRIKET